MTYINPSNFLLDYQELFEFCLQPNQPDISLIMIERKKFIPKNSTNQNRDTININSTNQENQNDQE